MKIKPQNRQSLADIALQTSGGLDALFALAVANDLPIPEVLPDMELETAGVVDSIVLGRYQARKVCPATELTQDDINVIPFEGIGFMAIEIDFIVS